MKELKINIAGHANTGKTTMGELILHCLAKEGFDVILNDIDFIDGVKFDFFDKRIEALKKQDLQITIETTQLMRSAYTNH